MNKCQSTWLGLGVLGGGILVILLLTFSLWTTDSFRGKPARYWLRALKDEDTSVAADARRELEEGGPEAVPILLEGLKDGSTWEHCAKILRDMQPRPVATLLVALEDKHALVRAGAALALENCGPDEKKVVATALLEALKDKSNQKDSGFIVRRHAILSLSSIGPATDEVIPALVEILKGENQDLRNCAAFALGDFGPKAKAAVPTLVDLLALREKPGWMEGGDELAKALRRIDPETARREGKKAAIALVEALKDRNKAVRLRAIQNLVGIAPASNEAIPVLLDILRNDDPEMQVYATYALGSFGPKSKAAVPILLDLLKRGEKPVADQAAEALKKIDPETARKAGIREEGQEKEPGEGNG